MGDFTINISAELIKQLVEDGQKSERRPKKTKAKPQQPKQPQSKVKPKQAFDDPNPQIGPVVPGSGWPLPAPLFMPPVSQSAQAAELDAIRSVLHESERVLENLNKKEESMVQEVTERAKTLRDQEFKLPYQKPLPCLAEKEAIEACYKESIKTPLKCQSLLRNYTDCSRKARQLLGSGK